MTGQTCFAAEIPAGLYTRDPQIVDRLLYHHADQETVTVAAATREELLQLGAQPQDIRPARVYRPEETAPDNARFDHDGWGLVYVG